MGTYLPSPKRGRSSPIFGLCLLWPNGWIDEDGTWHGDGPRSRPHCARWGPSSPSQKGQSPSQFPVHFYCGQTAGWIKMPLGMQVGLSPGDSVLDGDPAPLRTKGVELPPLFSVHFYCGQTAGCIKMPLGMEVGLSPGDFVLDGDPARPLHNKGAEPPIFSPVSIVAKRLDASRCCGGWPQPRRLCDRWGPSPLTQSGGAPQFRPMYIVAKLLDCSRWHLTGR